MSGGIYVVRGDDLVEMAETPFENEDLFQKLLAKYPRVLGGDQLDGSAPKRWLLISREAGIPDVEDGADRWSVDHLFVDEEAIPTFVEVKRKSDTRLRREVVGQMLDYVSHAVKNWSVDRLREVFEASCGDGDPGQVLSAALPSAEVPDVFWAQVGANLRSGTIRLVFVADQFPPELRRVVEFLNEQMKPAEVLGIEVRQYIGEGLQTLVPHVIGLQAAAARGGGSGPRVAWTRDRFFEDMASRPESADATGVAEDLLEFGVRLCSRPVEWGTGQGWGSFTAALRTAGDRFSLFSVYSTGHFSMNIGWSNSRLEPLGMHFSEELRERVVKELHLDFDRPAWERGTKTDLHYLTPERLIVFKGIMQEFAEDIRQRAPKFTGQGIA